MNANGVIERSQGKELLFGDLWDYAPAPENPDFVSYEKQYGHFINGKFVKGKDHFTSINPATEETLVEIATADPATVDQAVKVARKAFKGWSGIERGKYLYKLGRLIQENARELSGFDQSK